MENEDEEAFIAGIELAIDWHLEITEKQWKRYLEIIQGGKENDFSEKE